MAGPEGTIEEGGSDVEPTGRPPLRDLSFVWVCGGSEPAAEDVLETWVQVVGDQERPAELVIVNNGRGLEFRDQLLERLGRTGLRWTVVTLHRESSASMCLTAAFRHASGDGIVLLPAYVQSNPQDVRALVDELESGADYVASRRVARVDSPGAQRRSRLFNRVSRWIGGTEVHDVNSGLRAMRREVLSELPLYGDLHLFLPSLAARRGFRVSEVEVRHRAERNQDASNPVAVYLRRALDLLTMFFLLRFTEKPFRFFGGVGTALVAAGGLANAVLAVQRVVFEQPLAERPMLVLATLALVLGLQMFSLGLLGELIIFVNAGGNSDYAIEQVFESARSGPDPSTHATAGPVTKIR